jgi:hypothetical protein
MRRDSAGIAAALDSGEADAGLVWGPELAGTQLSYDANFQAPAALRWNLHGALRTANAELREAIDVVLAHSDARAEIDASLRRHGIPVRRPFASVHQLDMLTEQ